MNLKLAASTLLLSAASTLAFGADVSRSISGNIVTCQANHGCFNQLINGRIYKVMKTPAMVVKLSVWSEGSVTRADVIIANNSGLQLNILATDFRVDVLSPKPKTLAFVPHQANSPIAIPGIVPIDPPTELSKNSLDPDRNLHGRVSFERDPGAQQMNVVLPISGAVFEFPYVLQP